MSRAVVASVRGWVGGCVGRALFGRSEQPPVRDRPHPWGERFDLAPAGYDETQAFRLARNSGQVCFEEVRDGTRIGPVRALRSLGFDGKEARSIMQHEIDFATGTCPVELKGRWVLLPRTPSQELCEESRFEQRAVPVADFSQDSGKTRVGPVELWALYQSSAQRWEQGAQKKDLIGNLEEPEVSANRIYGYPQFPRYLGVRENLPGAAGEEVLGQGKLVEVGHPPQVGEVSLQVRFAEVSQPHQTVLVGKWFEGGIAAPQPVVFRERAEPARLIGSDGNGCELLDRCFPFPPNQIEARRWHCGLRYALDQRKRPEFQQGSSASKGFSHFLKQQDLGRTEQQEPVSLLPVGQEFYRIQQGGLLLDFVEDDKPVAMIEPAHWVGREAQSLVGVVEGQIQRIWSTAPRQEVADKRGLSGLARPSENNDWPALQARSEKGQDTPRMEKHPDILSVPLQKCKAFLQTHCTIVHRAPRWRGISPTPRPGALPGEHGALRRCGDLGDLLVGMEAR
mgnify:CR=1 FL=1